MFFYRSISEGGMTPAQSIHSSLSSEMATELSVLPPRGFVTLVFMDVYRSADVSSSLLFMYFFNTNFLLVVGSRPNHNVHFFEIIYENYETSS